MVFPFTKSLVDKLVLCHLNKLESHCEAVLFRSKRSGAISPLQQRKLRRRKGTALQQKALAVTA